MAFRMWIQRTRLLQVILLLSTVGCKSPWETHDVEFARLPPVVYQCSHAEAAVNVSVNPVADDLRGPLPVEEYIRFALTQNAGIQAARKRLDAAAMRVPQAASLKDPMLDLTSWPIFPNVPQTASGRMTVDLAISQEVPWYGKLDTAACAAEADVNAARAELATVELQVVEQVKRAYYSLYYTQKATKVTQQDREVLADLLQVADVLYKTGKTSQQDVLRLQAELSNVDGNLVQLRQMRAEAQADLAKVLHVSPETPLGAVDQLSTEEAPRDLDALYQHAVMCRPELHAMLAEVDRDRHMADLARLNYYPDATFKFGWGGMSTNRAIAPTADGIDNLALGFSMNVPLYRGRLKAAVREAEATAVASAREYDQLKDDTQGDVKQLFAQATSEKELERLFRESIIPKTQQALDVAVRGYQVGEIDFADLIANWRELLRFHIMQLQFEVQLRQTLASLERTVGGLSAPPLEPIPPPTMSPDMKPERIPPPGELQDNQKKQKPDEPMEARRTGTEDQWIWHER